MYKSDPSAPSSEWRRPGVVISSLMLAGMFFASGVPTAEGSGPDVAAPLRAQAEIEAAVYCYAEGTDAVGRGDIEEGKSIYRRCFAEDGIFEAYLPGSDPEGPPDAAAVGPDAAAELSAGFYAVGGYSATQHKVTNLRISVRGSRATVVSYAEATHVIDASSSIDVAHGTYVDHLVRTARGWKIARRTLHTLTFLRLESPPGMLPAAPMSM